MQPVTLEKVVNLAKRRGFVFQSSEIYGGINGFWDYGPLGAELKRNLREAWWQFMVRQRDDNVGLDATIIMHPSIWKASGHVDTFSDPMSTCKNCKKLVRADQIWEIAGEQPWYQALAELAPAGLAESGKLAAWLKGKGARQAPGLAAVRKTDECLAHLGILPAAHSTQSLACQLASEPGQGAITPCPHCGGELTEPKPFNLMFTTHTGPVQSDENIAYLRPETAQAIFAQFKNILDTSRQKIPFGICQIGKAFRNEVTPRNFTFRSREFEQMECEFFIKPDEAIQIISGSVATWHEGADLSTPQANWGWQMWHRYWVAQRTAFYASIGLGREVLEYYWQTADELAHYARACVDILFKFPFGTQELEGIAARGDFDLSQHQKHAGKPLWYFDEELKAAAAKLSDEQKEAMIQQRLAAEAAKTKGEPMSEESVRDWFERLFKGFYLPHVIEPSAGLDRMALAILCAAYREEITTDDKGKEEISLTLGLHASIAPVKVAVFPLLKNKPELVAKAEAIYRSLKREFPAFYDETGAVGRRYARQDEIGTPFCITVDFDTLGEKGPELLDTVTVRERDSGTQQRLPISELAAFLKERTRF